MLMSFMLNHSLRALLRARVGAHVLLLPALLLLLSAALWPQASFAQAPPLAQGDTPTVHILHFTGSPDTSRGAVFWFGTLNPASNAANVRLAYNDEELAVQFHIFDRRVVYDEAAAPSRDLTQWDAVSLYLDTQGDLNAPLGSGSYRFDAQLSHWQGRTNYQRAYRWQDSAWQPAAVTFGTEVGFRGYPNDQEDDRGWIAGFSLPFADLGLTVPAPGSQWRMALVLHDRDEVSGAPLPAQGWPQNVALGQPRSWGQISFGAPVYTPPSVDDIKTLTIRHGVNGINAPDGAVGGHSECGKQFDPNFFDGWGDANYANYAQINIQNQWDVADWPCFSRYYVNFPLGELPNNTGIVSATLTMYMFGNAGYTGDDAKPSLIQAARVAGDWDESTLTWNNSPALLENTGWTVVNPMQEGDPVPKPVTWDVTQAVADAHAAGEPLRLSLYSGDGDYHSGKYFWSADAGEELRPVLKITLGNEGYTISAVPIEPAIRSGGTARYELNVAGLSSGETVTLEAGQSSPAGLEVTVTPATIAAPGGTALITLRDRTNGDSGQSTVYTVPVTASNGQETRTAELAVLVNGQFIYLPSVLR
jgi:hypothetical protein